MASEDLSFRQRLTREIVPTTGQALIALILSLIIIGVNQSQSLMTKLGITSAGVEESRQTFLGRIHSLIISPIAANLALITFWATVGLVAYLVCWMFYNFIIEARNEVTLETAYTNRGHWHGPWQTLGLKLLCGLLLVTVLVTLRATGPYWASLGHSVFESVSLGSVAATIAGIIGLAINLYLVLALIQLTFTPWYRVKTFT
jgi:hypothetical protein